jgi:hypothetical protein
MAPTVATTVPGKVGFCAIPAGAGTLMIG